MAVAPDTLELVLTVQAAVGTKEVEILTTLARCSCVKMYLCFAGWGTGGGGGGGMGPPSGAWGPGGGGGGGASGGMMGSQGTGPAGWGSTPPGWQGQGGGFVLCLILFKSGKFFFHGFFNSRRWSLERRWWRRRFNWWTNLGRRTALNTHSFFLRISSLLSNLIFCVSVSDFF